MVISALTGYAIEAKDGRLGTVKDCLFDDRTWKIRWLVVDTGGWLSGRKVLLHPSVIGAIDHERGALAVSLTKQQVSDSPDIATDAPVSRQMQFHLYDYYGWDPGWGGTGYFGTSLGAIGAPFGGAAYLQGNHRYDAELAVDQLEHGDPHLRSTNAVRRYHVHARDGSIGHIENFLADDAAWDIRYLIVDTRDWWIGQHVLIAPFAVSEIRWNDRIVALNVSRDQVKASPPWDAASVVEHAYEKRLHGYYDWPGYGW
jgi:hypothetical protein